MKQVSLKKCTCLVAVAPYVGAWIETKHIYRDTLRASVAPYVGAWIETLKIIWATLSGGVAPYVGAWIETSVTMLSGLTRLSHPTWVRGLKLVAPIL